MARGNSIRIIGGRHRGRRLRFPGVVGLRPTADRLRETLFNWLQFEVEGARCLDLFAGSGALGLEALSRGAGFVQFVDQASAVVRQLHENIEMLRLQERASVVRGDASRLLRACPKLPFDLVFLDPPYVLKTLPQLCGLLEENGWLADKAWIYLEQESRRSWFELPAGWSVHRQATVGQAACRLVRRVKITDSP